jgi:hypothetical protein
MAALGVVDTMAILVNNVLNWTIASKSVRNLFGDTTGAFLM